VTSRAFPWLWLGAMALVHLGMIASGRWPLSPDEAHYWEWSRRLDWSYYSKGPLVAYLIALSTGLGQPTAFWVRLPAVLLGTLTGGLAWLLARRMIGEAGAALALVMLSVMPLYAAGSLLMTIDAPFVCCWALAWWCVSHVGPHRGELAWYGAGVAFGLGLLSKYTMLLFVPCVAVWLAGSPVLRRWLWRREPYDALLLGLLMFSPVLIWNTRHGWVSLAHVAGQAFAGSGPAWTWSSAPEFLGGQLAVASPLLFFLCGAGLGWCQQEGRRRDRDDLRLLVCASVPVWILFALWSLVSKVQANWPAPALFTAAIAAAGWCTRPHGGRAHRTLRNLNRLVAASIMLPVLALPLLLEPSVLGAVRLPVPRWLEFVPKHVRGWPELGAAVAALARRSERPLFIASDRYQIASELAFYVPGQPRTYNINLGRRMNQYDIWGDVDRLRGQDGVVVTYRMEAPPPELQEAFDSLELAEQVTIADHGRPVQRFTLFRGQGFRGVPPRPFTGY
jgi:4-amino-4-deoxy-L-arabinose transferase-like glycosyltransferase